MKNRYVPREGHASDILRHVQSFCRVEQVLITDHDHSIDVRIKLVVVWIESIKRNRGSHLEETISNEFQTFIVGAHARSKIDPLFIVLLAVIRVLCASLESQGRTDFDAHDISRFEGDHIVFDSVDNRWKHDEHGNYVEWELSTGQWQILTKGSVLTADILNG